MKFCRNDLKDICEVHISQIWNFEINDVMAAILHVFSGALSRSQFLSDLLQNWTWCRITSPLVFNLKSAKSVGNFRFYEEPRVRTRAAPFMTSEGQEFNPYLGRFFGFCVFLCEWSFLTNSDLLVTNLIIFFFIKDVTSDLVGKISKNGRNCVYNLLQLILF